MPFSSQWLANPGVAYEIDQSCRFNDNDSSYLTRTPGSAGNRRTWTLSVWVKRGNMNPTSTTEKNFFNAGVSGSGSDQETEFKFYDSSTGNMRIYDYSGLSPSDTYYFDLVTDRVFRDPSSWYHLVFKMDTTQSTAADRFVIYANGETVAVSSRGGESIYPDQDHETSVCDDVVHVIGKFSGANIQYFDGYLAEMHLVDGTALTAASFGETNSTTGQWVPKEYTGSYGTTGFYLAFQDSSALGDDTSGNGNDWTSSGLAAADQMTDSPTNNHCTLNPLLDDGGGGPTPYPLSDGNLVAAATADARTYGNVAFDIEDADGFYWEAKVTTAATYPNVAIRSVEGANEDDGSATSVGRYNFIGSSGNFSQPSGTGSYGTAWSGTADKVIGVLAKAGSLYFSIDGTVQNSGTAAVTGLTGYFLPLIFYDAGGGTQAAWEMRFAANMWSTTPSGYKAICTANLDAPTIADPSAYFQTTLYTGDGASSLAVNQGGNSTFEPDLVWIKNRDAVSNNLLFDAVRGATKWIPSNDGDVEETEADTLLSFDSDGFSVGDSSRVNTNTEKYVGWQWLEDATPGFDIVSFTGNGSNRTISHSLSAVPELIILKNLDTIIDWSVYTAMTGNTHYLGLNSTAVSNDNDTYWNDTTPTSSVFTVGTHNSVNKSSSPFIAYLFAGVEGFSKFGKYTGNGDTDGPFVWCGFRPAFILEKNASSLDDWVMWDNQRNPYNVSGTVLKPNVTDAETTASSKYIDFLSNGFKLRASDTGVNGDGNTHIFWAWAKTPFKTALAR